MTVDFDEALTLLHSHLKLERDRGLDLLKRNLHDMKQEQQTDDIIVNLRAKILGYIEPSTTSTWETRQGGLLAAKLIVSSKLTDENFVEIVRMRAMALTDDNEARVRQTAGINYVIFGHICALFTNLALLVLNLSQAFCDLNHLFCFTLYKVAMRPDAQKCPTILLIRARVLPLNGLIRLSAHAPL